MSIDLTKIAPLTEAEADDYFSRPTITDKFVAAIGAMRKAGLMAEADDVLAYVRVTRNQIESAYQSGRDHAWTRPGFGEMGG